MQARFIAQSFDPSLEESAGKELLHSLASGRFNSLLAMSAFASPKGVNTLGEAVKAAALGTVRFVVGVDQQGTSKEALEALLHFQMDYPAANVWIFYQPESVIYHPKLYLLEGTDEVQVLIGSSNLTGNGLFRNVEAGALLTLSPSDATDAAWLDTFRQQLAGFYTLSDPNLQPLSAELIAELVAEELVPDQATVRQRYAKTKPTTPTAATASKRLFPKRKTATRPTSGTLRSVRLRTSAAAITAVSDFELVWERIGLPASSVQQAGSGTNPTGGLRLVQARYQVNSHVIDQTTYFRNTLFGHLPWHEASHHPFVEITTVLFQVAIRGKELGDIPLTVRHKPSGEAGQHNYTTSISWGNLGKDVQDANLVGTTGRILRSASDPARFRLEIR